MTRTLSTLSLLCVLGCGGGDSPTPAAPAASAQEPAAAAPTPAAPAGPAIEENHFRLAFDGAAPYTAGQPGGLKVVIESRGGYHLNQDYPVRVDLKAPAAVKLQKPSLGKTDAAPPFGEKSATFPVGFTADKGSHDLSATVDFAVCTADTCVPEQRTIAIALNVQ
jgi:hypothetical protein